MAFEIGGSFQEVRLGRTLHVQTHAAGSDISGFLCLFDTADSRRTDPAKLRTGQGSER
jgi:hypothetical protein